jgi:hypothetical protein
MWDGYAYLAEVNKEDRDPERLAITIDMIMGQYRNLRGKQGYGIAQMAVHTAQLLGYTTLSRVSESWRGGAPTSFRMCVI